MKHLIATVILCALCYPIYLGFKRWQASPRGVDDLMPGISPSEVAAVLGKFDVIVAVSQDAKTVIVSYPSKSHNGEPYWAKFSNGILLEAGTARDMRAMWLSRYLTQNSTARCAHFLKDFSQLPACSSLLDGEAKVIRDVAVGLVY